MKRTILLTGASGVVGAALLPRLARHRVICLVHRNKPEAAEIVLGDLTIPGLGLDSCTYRNLAREVDVVVHCAATTDFSAGADPTRELNVTGTARLLEFAADAGATLHYVSSAFVARSEASRADIGDGTADPRDYLASKRAAEQLVRDSGIPGTILRPSVVIGDSATGAIAKFQALYLLAAAIVRKTLPLLPLRPDDRVDLVPQDVLADAVAAVVKHDVRGAEHWITAGEAALTAGRVVELIVAAGDRAGLDVRAPRLVDPEMVDRLVRPAFLEHLPPVTRRRFEDMLAMTALVAGATAFPATLAEIPGCRPIETPVLACAFDRSIGHLIGAMGWGRSGESAA
ncbi:SDR family oxidoreductase [Amycolatopsis sp. GM8]|uniref:SDR family oxidoreductase n=1 Tax=Amycolatopsis sp. GM8 TaxID=2896530 RepID=UPI001F1DFEFD|nr:SDR family oxidoreductase [Amycolatopsis sp. GM8]